MLVKLVSICLCVFLTASAGDWQASGNFTSENFTKINATIDKMLTASTSTGFLQKDMPKMISDDLNTAWDPAWNVFVIGFADPSYNAVVYGYAFNTHWLWYNNYHKGGVATNLSFVIWKDYNCDVWSDYDGGNTIKMSVYFTNDLLDAYPPYFMSSDTKLFTDPWAVAYAMSTKAQ